MASATPLKDIDEQFLQCCICMEQLKEPKILPCLHKYCQECLKKIAKKGAKKIECVTCREQHTLPKDGIDGLKTDFNTKNIIEFIQLQDSIRVDPLRTCIHCKKWLKASAFCFRCNDFLCETCHEFHASSSMFKNHHPHIFSLSEAEAANLTLQKLSSLKEAPRCQGHPGKLSELCCTTCHNLPICMPCTYGEHKGHDLTEVTSLAKIQRERLRGKVVVLMQNKEKAYQMQEDIRKTREKLNHNVQGEELKRQEQLKAERERINKKIRNAKEELSRKQAELEGEVKAKTSMGKKDLEKRIKKLRQEYELVCEEERCEADASFKKLRKENKRETKRLQEGLRVVNDEFKELLTSLKTQKDEQAKKIKRLSDHFDGIVKRFETVSTTINCIRAAENVWADVQCIPDVCRAITLLSKDVKKGSTGLENLSAVKSKKDVLDLKDKTSNQATLPTQTRPVVGPVQHSTFTGFSFRAVGSGSLASQWSSSPVFQNFKSTPATTTAASSPFAGFSFEAVGSGSPASQWTSSPAFQNFKSTPATTTTAPSPFAGFSFKPSQSDSSSSEATQQYPQPKALLSGGTGTPTKYTARTPVWTPGRKPGHSLMGPMGATASPQRKTDSGAPSASESTAPNSTSSGFQGFYFARKPTTTDVKGAPSSFAGSSKFNFRLDVDSVAPFSPKLEKEPTVTSPAVMYPGLNKFYRSYKRNDLHFESVVTLLENVKLETGEEGEEVRFKHRAKLYRWDRDGSQWKERGVGDIKVLFNPETNKYRIVMRREQVLKVCANHFITEQVDPQPRAGSDRSWVWQAMDVSDGEVQYEQLAVRFKTGDAARDFKDAVDVAKKDS